MDKLNTKKLATVCFGAAAVGAIVGFGGALLMFSSIAKRRRMEQEIAAARAGAIQGMEHVPRQPVDQLDGPPAEAAAEEPQCAAAATVQSEKAEEVADLAKQGVPAAVITAMTGVPVEEKPKTPAEIGKELITTAILKATGADGVI